MSDAAAMCWIEPRTLSRVERVFAQFLRHVPSAIRGKHLLARALFSASDLGAPIRISLANDMELVAPSLKEPVAFHCLVDGVYEPETLAFLLRATPAGGIFLDVGANIGFFTVHAARRVGAGGRVLAIEASPDIANFLCQNVHRNGCDNVEVVRCAVTFDGPGSLEFWPAPLDRFGMGSLAPQFNRSPIQVPSDAIEHILATHGLARVDVLKMDVEGFERPAFEGAFGLLHREDAPTIVFEFNDWAERRAGYEPGAAQAYLMELGFRLSRLAPGPSLVVLEHPLTKGATEVVALKRAAPARIPVAATGG